MLASEREAVEVVADAKRQAAKIIADAEQTASQLQTTTLEEARRQVKQIMLTGRIEAETERARIIAHAEGEAQHIETLAAYHLDKAVDFVLRQV
ncbi:MAG: hypothetical protein JXA33_09525, partial [Anaerolineae bacterium]|nr:hypothetical protein [Anaerolineae bacterium]